MPIYPMTPSAERICRRLDISDVRFVEIENKKRVVPEEAKDLCKFLAKRKKTRHTKRTTFFDQFLDTTGLDVLKAGASLRLRYKGDGSNVYLQYKGPGFHRDGLLYRSEFSTAKLEEVVREESHHDIVHFADTTVRRILKERVPLPMLAAMKSHLGPGVLARINTGTILASYQKDKFLVDLGNAFLEPSVDRLFAFHINRAGLHSLSTFWEYENEIKAGDDDLDAKLEHIPELLRFDKDVSRNFDLRPERLDKYHRCASLFLPR